MDVKVVLLDENKEALYRVRSQNSLVATSSALIRKECSSTRSSEVIMYSQPLPLERIFVDLRPCSVIVSQSLIPGGRIPVTKSLLPVALLPVPSAATRRQQYDRMPMYALLHAVSEHHVRTTKQQTRCILTTNVITHSMHNV